MLMASCVHVLSCSVADPRLSQQQEGTTYSLVLRDVTQHDAGVYTCLAHNPGGQVLCKAELLIHGGEWAPELSQVQAQEAAPADTVTLGDRGAG